MKSEIEVELGAKMTKFIVLTGSSKAVRVFPLFKNGDCEECKLFDTIEGAISERASIKRKWSYLLVWIVALNFDIKEVQIVDTTDQESMKNMLKRTGQKLSPETLDSMWEYGQNLL